MSTPSIKFTRRDNQLGIISAGDWNTLAVVGESIGGTLPDKTPARYTRSADAIAGLGKGKLVDVLCYLIENLGIAPVVCRATKVVDGAYGTLDDSGVTGDATVTAGTAKPYDDCDIVVTITKGGVTGTGPINYVYSLDGGLTQSAEKQLGTGLTFSMPEVNAEFDVDTAKNLAAGDVFSCRTSAPLTDTAGLDAALAALQNTMTTWDGVLILDPVDGTSAAAIETRAIAMETAEREKMFFCNFRRPTVGETEAAYKTAFDTAFTSLDAPYLSIGADGTDSLSPILFARLWRPAAMAAAGRFSITRPGRDLAAVADGALPASSTITDGLGNPKRHDERVFPGLDDSRATTLRTWIGRTGTYICNGRIMSPVGSDIQFVQHRRVSNLVCFIVRQALQLYESDSIAVDPTSGYIREPDARDVEANVNAMLKTYVIDTGDVSDVVFTLNRDDNVLSTFKLNGVCRITPLAYPKFFNVDIGFYNPALKVTPGPA